MLVGKKKRPLGRILEVNQNERGTFVRRLTVKTKAADPMISLSLACIRVKERNQDSKRSVTLRVKSVKQASGRSLLRAVSSACGSWLCISHSHAITIYRTLLFCSCLRCYPRILEQERDCSQSMS